MVFIIYNSLIVQNRSFNRRVPRPGVGNLRLFRSEVTNFYVHTQNNYFITKKKKIFVCIKNIYMYILFYIICLLLLRI